MDNTCICCGAVIPEGRQLCPKCSSEIGEKKLSSELATLIAVIVRNVISEQTAKNLLIDSDEIAYKAVSERLQRFYAPYGDTDTELSNVLETLKYDRYKHIIWMFYRDGKTIEEIAEKLGVDSRTISRNKRRLCLAIYKKLHR